MQARYRTNHKCAINFQKPSGEVSGGVGDKGAVAVSLQEKIEKSVKAIMGTLRKHQRHLLLLVCNTDHQPAISQ